MSDQQSNPAQEPVDTSDFTEAEKAEVASIAASAPKKEPREFSLTVLIVCMVACLAIGGVVGANIHKAVAGGSEASDASKSKDVDDKDRVDLDNLTDDQKRRMGNIVEGADLPGKIGEVIGATCSDMSVDLLKDATSFQYSSCKETGNGGNVGIIINTPSSEILDKVLDEATPKSLDMARGDTAAFVGRYGNASDVADAMGWELVEAEDE